MVYSFVLRTSKGDRLYLVQTSGDLFYIVEEKKRELALEHNVSTRDVELIMYMNLDPHSWGEIILSFVGMLAIGGLLLVLLDYIF